MSDLNKLNEAIEKLEAEIKSNVDNPYIQYVGKRMIEYLTSHVERSDSILTEGKTIVGSMKFMRDVAKNKQSGGVAVLTPDEGFKAVLDYYGIKENALVKESVSTSQKKRKVDIKLDDLF